jgi:hypothetical protein
MFKKEYWIQKLAGNVPQAKRFVMPTPAAKPEVKREAAPVTPEVKPASDDVDFHIGVANVGGINTKVSKETTKTVATVAAGAFAAVLGVVAVIVCGGRRS